MMTVLQAALRRCATTLKSKGKTEENNYLIHNNNGRKFKKSINRMG